MKWTDVSFTEAATEPRSEVCSYVSQNLENCSQSYNFNINIYHISYPTFRAIYSLSLIANCMKHLLLQVALSLYATLQSIITVYL